jgi:hypothetical protein
VRRPRPTLLTRIKLLMYDLGLRKRRRLCAEHMSTKVGTSSYLTDEKGCEKCSEQN